MTCSQRHGLSPDGMLSGTMITIPKGRWANLSNCEKVRSNTLNSTLCKILDVVILPKKVTIYALVIKPSGSTSRCTSMVQETISYYVNYGSNI